MRNEFINEPDYGRTLEDLVDDYIGTNKRLYLGSSNSFFFIGTAKELKHQSRNINKIFKNLLNVRIKEINQDLTKIQTLLKKLYDDLTKKHKKKELKELQSKIERTKKRLESKERYLANTKKRLDDYQPIMKRTVFYTYEKDAFTDELGIAIKIDGNEDGKYWTYKEWLKYGGLKIYKRRIKDGKHMKIL